MAVPETSVSAKTRETMNNSPKKEKKRLKKVLVVAQELKLARVLAGNNKTARDRALKGLRKWFQNRSKTIPFTEDDFLRLWKGLFYSMWMSDKPLVQEECAENISNLLHFLPLDSSILFYKCGMRILMNEWFGIDQHRLDKFLMFVRRLLRQALFVLRNDNWTKDTIHKFIHVLSDTILELDSQKPIGLLLHFIEIYLEELAKVSDGQLPPQLTTNFLLPFIKQLAFADDARIIDHIRKHIFVFLIRQSDLGLEYDEKYAAWKSIGFPGSIDSMKKIESNNIENDYGGSDDNNEKILDPRAGRVDVELSQIRFHAKAIVKALSDSKFLKGTNSKSRKCMTELIEHFKKLAAGVYPLGIKKVKKDSGDYDMSIRKAVNRLVKFDQKIKGNKKRKNNEVVLEGGKKMKEDMVPNNEVELRSGRKVKLDDGLVTQIHNELEGLTRKKRNSNVPIDDETVTKKQKLEDAMLEVESIFKRNSGTWLVTKTIPRQRKKIKILTDNWFDEESESLITDESNDLVESQPTFKLNHLFPKNKWESSNDQTVIEIEKNLKRRFTLDPNLLRNPFSKSTPVKKVKINTKLNRSQDVREHQAQILSSPGIPYDANKKPSKPLLKTPVSKSPVNPFYIN